MVGDDTKHIERGLRMMVAWCHTDGDCDILFSKAKALLVGIIGVIVWLSFSLRRRLGSFTPLNPLLVHPPSPARDRRDAHTARTCAPCGVVFTDPFFTGIVCVYRHVVFFQGMIDCCWTTGLTLTLSLCVAYTAPPHPIEKI